MNQSESHGQANDHINHQSHNQLINQPDHHSYFSHLIPPLFVLICEYLTLKCKCYSLPVLSRSVKQLFNPASCCKGYIPVDLRRIDNSAYCPTLAKLAYAPYASSVYFIFDGIKDQHPNVKDTVRQILLAVIDNPDLHSMKFWDVSSHDINTKVDMMDFNIIYLMLTKLSQMPPSHFSKLRGLELNVGYCGSDAPPFFHWQSLGSSDIWRGLRSFTQLKTFTVRIASMPDSVFSLILDGLPDSLTELTVDHSATSRAVLNRKLISPKFLPHLRRLPRRNKGTRPQNNVELFIGLSTVIPDTGQCRPIEELDMVIERSGLSFMWCNQVHNLDVEFDLRFMDEFCAVTDDVLPLLRSFSVVAFDRRAGSRCDISPIIEFTSKRPIESLAIFGIRWSDVEGIERTPCTVTKHLANMKGLTSLKLDGLHLLFPADMLTTEHASLPPAGCWPQLTKLALNNLDWNPDTAERFIQAAPNLAELLVQYAPGDHLRTFSWVPLVPVVAQCCPDIISFIVKFYRMRGKVTDHKIVDDTALSQLQAAYVSWPLSNQGFQRLQRLEIDGWDVDQLATRWGLFECSSDSGNLVVSNRQTGSRFRALTDVPPVDGRQVFFERLYYCLEQRKQ